MWHIPSWHRRRLKHIWVDYCNEPEFLVGVRTLSFMFTSFGYGQGLVSSNEDGLWLYFKSPLNTYWDETYSPLRVKHFRKWWQMYKEFGIKLLESLWYA